MKQGYEVYQALLDAQIEKIREGHEVLLEVRDLQEFVRKIVRARVAEPGGSLDGSVLLWVRGHKEVMLEEPWQIQVLEEMDDDFQIEYPESSERPLSLYGKLLNEVESQGTAKT